MSKAANSSSRRGRGIRYLRNAIKAFFVLNAIGLHGGHGGIFRFAFLRAQDLTRVFERCLNHRNDVIGVGFAFWVEQFERCKQKWRKRLVKSEIFRQIHGYVVVGIAVFILFYLNNPCIDEGAEYLAGAHFQLQLVFRLLE